MTADRRATSTATSSRPHGESEHETRTGPPPASDSALVSNTAVLVAGRYSVAALGWLGTLVVIRSLSVEQFGRFSFVFSLLGLLAVFTELGIGRVAIKGLVTDDSQRGHFAGTLVVLRAVMGAVGYVVAVGFVLVFGYPSEVVRATAVGGLILLLATPSNAIQGVFQAHLQMGPVAVGNVLGQLSQIALITAIATVGGSVVLFTVPAVICEATILVWKLHRVRRLHRIRLNVDFAVWRRLLREAAPLAAGTILATFYFKVDLLMLSKLDSFTGVGIYGVAYKFVDLFHDLPSAMLIPVLALLVRAWPHDEEAFAHTFRRALLLLVATGVLVAVEFAVFARPAISLLYGDQYAAGAGAARLIVAAECLASLGRLVFTVLVATGRHRAYPLIALAGLAANVVLNLWLIPRHSYQGAALATVATEVLVVGLLSVTVVRMPMLRPLPLRPLALIVVAGAACVVVAGQTRHWAPWPVAAALAAAAYVALLHLANRRRGGLVGLLLLRTGQ